MRKWIVLSLLFLGAGCSPVQPVVVFSNETVVHVDIADDNFEREKGLSGRESLEADEGLLFLHDELEYQRYWMKGMLIPIDILWIDGERVVGFVQDAQPEDPATTIYSSPAPVDKVLEVSAGFVSQNDLKIGDILDIQLANE